MKVGIDARFLTHPQRGGFKTYTHTVVSALAEVDRENEYFLYTDRPDDSLEQFRANFRIVPVTAANAILREQFVLPTRMQRDGIDVAHFPCNTAPVFRAPKMVVTVHDVIALCGSKNRTGTLDTHHRALRAYWRTVIPRAARTSALIVTSSDFALTDIAATLRLPRSKFRIAFIAVGRSFNAAAEGARPAAITAHDRFVMSFAATDGRKNHPTTIEAFRRIREEFPELKLVLVCSHQNMREQLLESPEERVIPVGPVSLPELVWLYRNAQVMAFPSLDEGFGLPPLEALACGTPVIASNSGSLPEVLGQAAQLTDPKDVEGIAENMRRILLDPALRKSLSSQGLEHAKEFTHEAMGRKLVEVYLEAFNAERRGSS